MSRFYNIDQNSEDWDELRRGKFTASTFADLFMDKKTQGYQKAIIKAFAEVENAIISVRTYNEEWNAAKRQTESARIYLKLSQARYDNGYVSYLEVLDAERSLFDSELNLSQLSEQKLSSVMLLYRALGGGW